MKKFMAKHKHTCLTMVIIVTILVGLIVLFKKDMIEGVTSETPPQMPPSATPIQTNTTADIPTPTESDYEKASKAFAEQQIALAKQMAEQSKAQQHSEMLSAEMVTRDGVEENIVQSNTSVNIRGVSMRSPEEQQFTDSPSSTQKMKSIMGFWTKPFESGNSYDKKRMIVQLVILLLWLMIHIIAIVMCFVCNQGKFDFTSFFGAVVFSPLYIIYQLTQGCNPKGKKVSINTANGNINNILHSKPSVATLLKKQ